MLCELNLRLAQHHVLEALHQADDGLGVDAEQYHQNGGEQHHQAP